MIGVLLSLAARDGATAAELEIVQSASPLWFYFVMTVVYGGCVGSFLNVVVYRLPLRMSLVSPPSTCPQCSHRLAWYDNIPVFGWLKLLGKCRYCRNPISPQYPILEGFCALTFGAMFLAYYFTGDRARFMELPGQYTAIVFILHLFLLGGLIAASKIDANLFIIPLEIPWTVTVAAILTVPIAAAVYPPLYQHHLLPRAPLWGVGAAIGGTIGLTIAFILLWRGILPTSFLEPDQVAAIAEEKKKAAEKKSKREKKDKKNKKQKADPKKTTDSTPSPTSSPRAVGVSEGQTPPASDAAAADKPASAKTKAIYLLLLTAIAITLWLTAGVWGRFAGFVLMWWGVLLVDFGAYGNPADLKDHGPDNWYIHPRPRLETLKEVLYLALPVLGAVIGIAIVLEPGPTAAVQSMPAWAKALCGSVLGYLLGCGVVWFVRILGNLGFGKESMGLGDVHLVGCIGAVIGGNDAIIAFLLAAFFGLGYALIASTLGRLLVKRGVQIPYGPHLCGAAITLMLFRDPIQKIAETWMGLTIFIW